METTIQPVELAHTLPINEQKKGMPRLLWVLLLISLIANILLVVAYFTKTSTPNQVVTPTPTPTNTIIETPSVTPTVTVTSTPAVTSVPVSTNLTSIDAEKPDLRLEFTLPATISYVVEQQSTVVFSKGATKFMLIFLPSPVPGSLETFTNKTQVLAPNINNLYRITIKEPGDPQYPVVYTNKIESDTSCAQETQIGPAEPPCSDGSLNLKNGLKLRVLCANTADAIKFCDAIIKTIDLKKLEWLTP